MTSSRLPGKVLADIDGLPMLLRVVERVRRASRIDTVVVATSREASDGAIADICSASEIPCFRGSLHDVLDRYYQCMIEFHAEIVVRITADCPLIDPAVIDDTVDALWGRGVAQPRYDFSANRLPPPNDRTYPVGLDVEACTAPALSRAWSETGDPQHREHVMPFLYETQCFRTAVIQCEPGYGDFRLTVDEQADLDLVRAVYQRLPNAEDATWREVVRFLQASPELCRLNADVAQRHLLPGTGHDPKND
ncbi:MAG: NTP transferase domain-containing protein [Acidobacteria bacterium]|nr:NTP transferase domain-containing protein [Acidobacteriota bacterium]